eukprot:comp23456_c0_seq1/m.39163 comp23456_c0_seq1/g.39163  ORF comp23456_c0_seq1/g.39163 comp23456_c0_seq1/m.39163 type:complete len:384 (-) comp23456_c0_seq1:283-1434(-)
MQRWPSSTRGSRSSWSGAGRSCAFAGRGRLQRGRLRSAADKRRRLVLRRSNARPRRRLSASARPRRSAGPRGSAWQRLHASRLRRRGRSRRRLSACGRRSCVRWRRSAVVHVVVPMHPGRRNPPGPAGAARQQKRGVSPARHGGTARLRSQQHRQRQGVAHGVTVRLHVPVSPRGRGRQALGAAAGGTRRRPGRRTQMPLLGPGAGRLHGRRSLSAGTVGRSPLQRSGAGRTTRLRRGLPRAGARGGIGRLLGHHQGMRSHARRRDRVPGGELPGKGLRLAAAHGGTVRLLLPPRRRGPRRGAHLLPSARSYPRRNHKTTASPRSHVAAARFYILRICIGYWWVGAIYLSVCMYVCSMGPARQCYGVCGQVPLRVRGWRGGNN